MIYLIDTNILLRYLNNQDPQHSVVFNVVDNLKENGIQLQPASQSYVELRNVATRPLKYNGLGFTPQQTYKFLQELETIFPPLPDSYHIYPEWKRLVSHFDVLGVQVHDARLVASMLVHNISYILTLNIKDFARYRAAGIIAVDPNTLV